MNEASLHDENCFITLTYKEAGYNLVYKDFQDFMKRLRFRFRPRKIRFFMCGEYGEISSRPHFHAILFGFNFPDLELLSTRGGNRLYTSKLLEQLWPHGMSSVGSASFESAAYVARYVMKKVKDGSEFHGIYDPETGEIFERVKEFGHMSLGRGSDRGIGYRYYRNFKSDIYPRGKIVVNGRECRPPRYYDKMFRESDAGGWMKLCLSRSEEMYEHVGELAPERLESREIVSKARLSLSGRTI